MTKLRPYAVLSATLAALTAWVGPRALPAHAADRTTLRVFAAASLTDAFGEMARRYEQLHPDVSVQLNFAGSQQLVAQIEQGAAADVLASADDRWATYAREHGLLAGPPVVFAGNRLVVIVPRSNPARIRRLQDIARSGVKFVSSPEAVPVGHYTRVVLARLARMPGFEPDYARRVLANLVSEEENVRAIAAKVQLGEADAGLVYRSDVTPALARHVSVLEIPDSANVLASYPIAVVRNAPVPAEAAAFVEFVLGGEGQRILGRWALLPAPPVDCR